MAVRNYYQQPSWHQEARVDGPGRSNYPTEAVLVIQQKRCLAELLGDSVKIGLD